MVLEIVLIIEEDLTKKHHFAYDVHIVARQPVKISEAPLRVYIDELGKTPFVAFLTPYNYPIYIMLRHNWPFFT